MENYKKITYKSVLAVAVLPLLLAMCSKSDIGPVLQTQVDLTKTIFAADQAYRHYMKVGACQPSKNQFGLVRLSSVQLG